VAALNHWKTENFNGNQVTSIASKVRGRSMNDIGKESPADIELIQQTLDGQTESFGLLVCRYQQRLYNGLVHMLRDEAEAEDATQEAFVLALTKLDSFRNQSAFFTWLYRIAFNAAISRMRKKRPVLSLQQDLTDSGMKLRGDTERPEDRMCRAEDIELIRSGLSRLAEQHRAILVLREIEGLSYEEISKILKLPIGTVRSRLHRARLQLKEELDTLIGVDSSAFDGTA